jgi:transcriptional regulator with XRE-family HTH domain
MHRGTTLNRMAISMLGTMGKRIRVLREEMELDQRQFAAAVTRRGVAITNSFISSLESGRSKPSIDVLRAIADELGVSADYLLLRTETPDSADDVRADMQRRLREATGQQRPAPEVGISEEAEQVAAIIDGLTEAQRALVLNIVRVVAAHAEMLKAGQPAVGLEGAQLILGKMLNGINDPAAMR